MTGRERVVAEIDLDAIAFNIQSIRKKAAGKARMMGVVKADAYGHGAVLTAKTLMENGVDAFAVATADEGMELRKAGITPTVLILGYTPEGQFEEIIKEHLTQTVFSLQMAERLSEAAVRMQERAMVHIKIDTGMGRIGFPQTAEAVLEIEKISRLPGIAIQGMFTHFCSSDEADKEFTYAQYQKFLWMKEELQKKGVAVPVCHAANSAAFIDCDELCLDYVRPGIILYGMYPSCEVKRETLPLKPAMCLKSTISFLKEVPEGTPIGYGRTYYTVKKSRIATLPVGYADGFLRAYGNGGRVLIRGAFAPIVGRICMDQMMVDVSDIEGVSEGDEVILLGRDGDLEIPAEELAERMGSIVYEVICCISKRTPRVYKKAGKVVRIIRHVGI